MNYNKISQEHLSRISYNDQVPSGIVWKNNVYLPTGGLRFKQGSMVGYLTKYGYFNCELGYKSYATHRLVYQLHHPLIDISNFQIDHIDRNRANNNIENLRLVNPSLNARNKSKRDRLLPTGISFEDKRNRYRAHISLPKLDGKYRSISCSFNIERFESGDDALNAAIKWREIKLKEINESLDLGYTNNHGK